MSDDDGIPGYGSVQSYGSQPTEAEILAARPSYPGYELVEVIGRGFFGKVWKAVRLSDNKTVALKVIQISIDPKIDMLKNLQREVSILKKISTPRCQPFLVCFNSYQYLPDTNEFLIDMNLIVGKNLLEYSNSVSGDIKYKHLLLIMKDITKALLYLHNNGIIHNDVKPDNILIDANKTPILVDFGVSCFDTSVCLLDNTTAPCCKDVQGPNKYISPETIKTKAYFTQSDIWSLGLTFYVVSSGVYPFDIGTGIQELFDRILKDPVKLQTGNEVLDYIVNRSLDKNPVTRISLEEINKILDQ